MIQRNKWIQYGRVPAQNQFIAKHVMHEFRNYARDVDISLPKLKFMMLMSGYFHLMPIENLLIRTR